MNLLPGTERKWIILIFCRIRFSNVTSLFKKILNGCALHVYVEVFLIKVLLLTLRAWMYMRFWVIRLTDYSLTDVKSCINVMYLPSLLSPLPALWIFLLTSGFCFLSLKICTINVYSLTYHRFCKPTGRLIKKFHELLFWFIFRLCLCTYRILSSIAFTHTPHTQKVKTGLIHFNF